MVGLLRVLGEGAVAEGEVGELPVLFPAYLVEPASDEVEETVEDAHLRVDFEGQAGVKGGKVGPDQHWFPCYY